MTPDEIARKVAEALPCRDTFYCELPNCDHTQDCPAHYRAAVEALVREAYEAGYRQGEKDGRMNEKEVQALREEGLL